ncbi:hypothetical protein ACFYMO_21895 [Streptomyces sp. NPDC007025]|uniref:hypothetical protein n=1 Tax=Streptomyces TaxID=1883 RepID=UPI0015875A5A|nr:hypothetical protein [Streptomyces qinglanensis]
MSVPDPTSYDDYIEARSCPLCWPEDGSEPYEGQHCCLCLANGGDERPDCTCL